MLQQVRQHEGDAIAARQQGDRLQPGLEGEARLVEVPELIAVPIELQAGSSATRAHLMASMTFSDAQAWTSISAGRPGGYCESQGVSIVPFAQGAGH